MKLDRIKVNFVLADVGQERHETFINCDCNLCKDFTAEESYNDWRKGIGDDKFSLLEVTYVYKA